MGELTYFAPVMTAILPYSEGISYSGFHMVVMFTVLK